MASNAEVGPLSSFTIVRPNASQSKAYLKAQFVPWNRGLTWEAQVDPFLQKFEELDGAAKAEAWSVNGGEQAWVLVKRDDPEGEIYSGCGTYRRHAFMKRKGSDQVERVVTYGVQSVVTPVQHHRNGYARHLLKLLHYVIGSPDSLPPFPEAWGSPPQKLEPSLRKDIPYAKAAFLWSDVGPTFYEKCTIGEHLPGYVMEEDKNRALVWKVLQRTEGTESGKAAWEWLYEQDVEHLRHHFSETAQHEMSQTSATDRAVIRTDPENVGTLSFLPLRAFAQTSLDPEERKKHPFGLRRRNADGKDTIVLLTPGLGAIYGRLCITIHDNLDSAHLPSLLSKMDELAPARGTKEGQIWGLDPQGQLAQAFAGIKERETDFHVRQGMDAHLCAVASYLPNGERPDFQDSRIWNWC